MQYFFYQPEYFLRFRCTGGECPYSCCYKWNIHWTKDEYERLVNSDYFTGQLRDTAEKSFEANSAYEKLIYTIKPCEDGSCPFLNKESGLCDIQKEAGEEYLGETCREFPREYLRIGSRVARYCMTSCPAVIKLLMHDKKAAQMEEIPIRNNDLGAVRYETPAKFAKVPYLEYRKEIIDFYSWLFTSRKNVEKALLMGALAAENISACVKDGVSINIPPALAYMKSEWKNKDPDIHTDKIGKDLRLKCSCIYMLIQGLENMPFDPDTLRDGDKTDEAKYLEGKNRFRSDIANADTALCNIAMNMFLNLFIGLDLIDHSFFDFYTYYSLCVTSALYLAYTAGYIGKDTENDFIKAAAIMCRKLIHNKNGANLMFGRFGRLSTSEQLAAIIQ